MTARLVHVLWLSRNPRADMPEAAWALVQQQVPEARDVPLHHPAWWATAWGCFRACSTERSLGFGVGPIPWSRIRQWGESRGLTGSTLRTLEHVVQAMDNKYLELEATRAEAERKR